MQLPEKKTLPIGVYRLMLIVASLMWGAGYVFAKPAVAAVGPIWVVAFRFIIAGVLMVLITLPVLRKHLTRKTLLMGAILSVISCSAYFALHAGLQHTTPGKNAFLQSTYCVIVPFMWWIIARSRPRKRIIAAAVICIIGCGLVSLDGSFSINLGDGLSLLAGLLYSGEIVFVSIIARKKHNMVAITTVQICTMGLLALIIALTTQPLPDFASLDGEFWGCIAYLGLGVSLFASLLQNVGQTKVPTNQAGLLMSLESVFGVAFSMLAGLEPYALQVFIGFALILIAVFMSQTKDEAEQP